MTSPKTSEPVRGKPLTNLRVGQALRGRYQILRVLGIGNMSAVYQARDLHFPNAMRLCAVKEVLIPGTQPALRAQQQEIFEREVNMLASLSHPAIPKIYEYFHEGESSYLVLEFIQGQDLYQLLRNSTALLPEQTVVEWAIEICEVLHYLHSRTPEPIVFRDMKPSNVMLNEHGRLILIDFGIAKVFRGENRGTMIGTEGYAPPEQYRGEATPRVDVYALGATMHHLLGRADPQKEAPFSFQQRPLHTLNSSVSAEVEAIIDRALSYEPRDRFASAMEMRQALIAALGRSEAGATSGPLPRLRAAGEIDPMWIYKCPDEIRSSPRIDKDTLYFGCYDHQLYALATAGGKLRWTYATKGGIAATPAVWKDLVVVGSEDFIVHAVSAETGEPAWTCPTKGRVRSSPRIAYEHAFFGSDDNNMYAVQAQSGRLVWKSPTGGPVRSSPALGDEALYVGCEDGYVYALNLQRGTMLWRHYCGGGVTSSPLLWQGLLIVGSTDRHVYALDLESGWPAWRYRTSKPIVSSPAVFDDTVYIGSADGCLYALEGTAGRLRWKLETEGQVNSSPAVTPEALYVGSSDGCLYAVDTRTGKVRWKFKSGGPLISSPCVGEGMVYVGSLDNRLYALPAVITEQE